MRPAEDEAEDNDSYFTIQMGSTLWETLIDNGVNPTTWRDVFEFNRDNNPAFRRIVNANRIPRGTMIYIPLESGPKPQAAQPSAAPSRTTAVDTVRLLDNVPFLKITSGSRVQINDVIRQYCIPARITGARERANLLRSLRADIRDLYRLAGLEFGNRDRTSYIPVHYTADQYTALEKRLSALYGSPDNFIRRDSLLAGSPTDILHVARRGESYRSLAETYLGSTARFPDTYVLKKSRPDHLRYMAQQIRHYNLNQELLPGKTYLVPGYLADVSYYEFNPPVHLSRRTKEFLYYDNSLKISLENHITRSKTYWKRRQQYLPPLGRELADGSPAYPDMIVWHRTGLEPEIEKVLREKGRTQFSLRYIFRMAVTNYYIDERGNCFLIVDPDKNPRDHAGSPAAFRCFWNGEGRVSDVSVGIEIEAGFQSVLTQAQLETARKLQQMIRSLYVIPADRVLDHRKVASRRGPGLRLLRGRKADGLTPGDRIAIGIPVVLDPDVLRGVADPNLNEIQQRRADSNDYWYLTDVDPDLEESARAAGWHQDDGRWYSPADSGGDLPVVQPSSD
ncbi:MAG: N-acetylmuramoyl-L-alanine amidase [Candidatus Glassbacteria bacterium]